MRFAYALAGLFTLVSAATKNKPHGHQGALEPYDGKPLPLKLTSAQSAKLEKGESVCFNERTGKSGRGVVIQDVNATRDICMSKVRDLPNYHKMVPHCKSVKIYESQKFMNGTTREGAEFKVGVLGMSFGYYLLLTHEPKYETLTWTLDYKYNSDFDDNCGHWQMMPHPTKSGWTRVLYSTKIKLFNWIPEFVVRFLTSKALTESTGWVKKESELEQAKIAAAAATVGPNKQQLSSSLSWLNMKGGMIRHSFDSKLKELEEDMRASRMRVTSMMRPIVRPSMK